MASLWEHSEGDDGSCQLAAWHNLPSSSSAPASKHNRQCRLTEKQATSDVEHERHAGLAMKQLVCLKFSLRILLHMKHISSIEFDPSLGHARGAFMFHGISARYILERVCATSASFGR